MKNIKDTWVIKILLATLILSITLLYSFSFPSDVDFTKIAGVHRASEINVLHIPFNRVLIGKKYIEVTSDYNGSKSFDDLVEYLKTVKYLEKPDGDLDKGANCQTLTIFVEDWCKLNNVHYAVEMEPFHVKIKIKKDEVWYVIDFDKELTIYNEYTGECV